MRVLLIMPPTDLVRSYGTLKRFSNPQPSIGLAYIAANLRKNGHGVKIIDAYVRGSSLEEIRRIVLEYDPDVVGISVLTPSAEVVYAIAEDIRKTAPRARLVMGNMHASLFCDEILMKGYADVIVHREGEATMVDLVAAIERGNDLGCVAGISFLEGGRVNNTPSRLHLEDLDSLPYPAWDLFPLEEYKTDPRSAINRGGRETHIQILATRGCPSQCTFCSSRTERSLGAKYRMRDPRMIVDEMVFMNNMYGANVFGFMDLSFPLVKAHAMAVCDELLRRGLEKTVRWVTECRVRPLDEELLAQMKRAGCVRLYFGIESGNDATLRRIKKGFNREHVKRAVEIANKVGLEVDAMFMLGLPGETEEVIRQTIEFSVELKVRYAIFNLFVPYPGCELWDELQGQGKITYRSWKEFTSYPTYSGGMPVYVPDGLSKESLMALQSEAMKRFYVRPRFIWGEITRFRLKKIPAYMEGLRGVLARRETSNT